MLMSDRNCRTGDKVFKIPAINISDILFAVKEKVTQAASNTPGSAEGNSITTEN